MGELKDMKIQRPVKSDRIRMRTAATRGAAQAQNKPRKKTSQGTHVSVTTSPKRNELLMRGKHHTSTRSLEALRSGLSVGCIEGPLCAVQARRVEAEVGVGACEKHACMTNSSSRSNTRCMAIASSENYTMETSGMARAKC